jgi:hypothetical protein
MTVVAMTRREFSRLEVVVAIEQGQMSASRAAELLGLSRRQIFRLLDRFRSIGPNGLASRKRGVPSNNQNHRLRAPIGDDARSSALRRSWLGLFHDGAMVDSRGSGGLPKQQHERHGDDR